jgi:hypothetical protein
MQVAGTMKSVSSGDFFRRPSATRASLKLQTSNFFSFSAHSSDSATDYRVSGQKPLTTDPLESFVIKGNQVSM